MKTVKLFTALLLAMVCISLSSCSKDKDKDEGDYDRSGLVGTWAWFSETNSEEDWLVFKSDGTGWGKEVYQGKSNKSDFVYKFNEKSLLLTVTWLDDEGDYEEEEIVEVILITDEKIVFKAYNGDEDIMTYYRQ